jgi:hypothetical protein
VPSGSVNVVLRASVSIAPACLATWLAFLLVAGYSALAAEYRGTVVDSVSASPIAGATVTLGDQSVVTDARGGYEIAGPESPLRFRAPGYRRQDVSQSPSIAAAPVRLDQLMPKALYLSVYGIGSRSLREAAFDVIQRAALNAVVIDLKGDRGLIPYASAVPLAGPSGALKVRTVSDLGALVTSLQARGIYTIARIVVFKDDLLAQARPDWAVRAKGGAVWKDREGLSWIDPYQKPAWDYSIEVAEEAAASGFDEVQFDYLRFPDARGLVYSQPSTQAGRIGAITGFLQEAKQRLTKYNVFLSVDVFGYVCWNPDDTQLGQRLEDLAPIVDYVSPMLYPSSFQFGIPGVRNPVEKPYDIVFRSLERAAARTAGSTVRFRAWLQSFRDYAFGGKVFGASEIKAQVGAAMDAGSIGWMLWNPRNVYSTDGLVTEEADKHR